MTLLLQELKTQFYSIAKAHGAAMVDGDYKVANKLHGQLTKLYNKTIDGNSDNLFLDFLNDPDENVCLWAATFSLKTNNKLAIETLKSLSHKETIVSLSANAILDLWDKGRLELL